MFTVYDIFIIGVKLRVELWRCKFLGDSGLIFALSCAKEKLPRSLNFKFIDLESLLSQAYDDLAT